MCASQVVLTRRVWVRVALSACAFAVLLEGCAQPQPVARPAQTATQTARRPAPSASQPVANPDATARRQVLREKLAATVAAPSGRRDRGGAVPAAGIPTPPPAESNLQPGSEPLLRLETGSQHTAQIKRMAVDGAGHWLVTAGYDKTARVWNLQTGQLERILRPPLGAASEGKLHAVAISPDGNLVATGGWTGYEWDHSNSIYIFERASGRMLQRLRGLNEIITDLSFAPDGQWLAAGLGAGGLRIWQKDAGSGALRPALSDTSYGGDILGLDFSPDGQRLAVSSYDGMVRLYFLGEKGWRSRKLASTVPGGRRPLGVRFSPSGQKLAVGFADSNAVNVLDGSTLAFLHAPDTSAVDMGDVGRVAWLAGPSGDEILAAGGQYKQEVGSLPILFWPDAGKGAPSLRHAATNTLVDLHKLPDGRLIFAAGDPAWGVFNAAGERQRFVTAPLADLRANWAGFQVNQDGSTVRFGYEQFGGQPIRFDLAGLQLVADTGSEPLLEPRLTAPGLEIGNWLNSPQPLLNGQPLQMKTHELGRSLALHPDGRGFVLGASFSLRRYDGQGRMVWDVPAASEVWTVNISGDGRVVVAAYGDGTIRWHRWTDGAELVALFPHADRKRWIAWIPEGHYAAAPGGEDLIGWHLNQGKEREARFIPNSQLYDVFYRPDIVQARFRGEDIKGLITLTAAEALRNPPPEVSYTLLPPSDDNPRAKVCYRINSSGGGIGEVRLFQNGKLVKSDGFYREVATKPAAEPLQLVAQTGSTLHRGLRLINSSAPAQAPVNKGEAVEECQEIDTLPGENELGVAAFNALNTVQSALATARFTSGRNGEAPHLYVLAVGIDQFKDTSANLRYAVKDSGDFLRRVQAQAAGLFAPEHIHVEHLTDQAADKAAIRRAIDGLAQRIQPWDSFVLFVASHGVMLGGQYYLVGAGYDGSDDRGQLLGSNEIVELSKQVRALSQLFIFDTCHAGGVDSIVSGLYDARMSVLARKMGLHIYAAAGGLQEALDGYRGNGLFTHTLLASLGAPETDRNRDRSISVEELGEAARDRTSSISRLLGHAQTPTMINFGRDQALFRVE